MHYYLFYTSMGSMVSTSDLSTSLHEQTTRYLRAGLDVSTYRHMAAAIGRRLEVGIIDPEEDEMTTGMDAQAGRLTTTSEKIYGLQKDEVGGINDRVITLFRATSRLWHNKVLGLPVRGRVVDLKTVLDHETTMSQLLGAEKEGEPDLSHAGRQRQSAAVEPPDISSIVRNLLKEAIEQDVMPQLLGMEERLMARLGVMMSSEGKPPPPAVTTSSPSLCSLNGVHTTPLPIPDVSTPAAIVDDEFEWEQPPSGEAMVCSLTSSDYARFMGTLSCQDDIHVSPGLQDRPRQEEDELRYIRPSQRNPGVGGGQQVRELPQNMVESRGEWNLKGVDQQRQQQPPQDNVQLTRNLEDEEVRYLKPSEWKLKVVNQQQRPQHDNVQPGDLETGKQQQQQQQQQQPPEDELPSQAAADEGKRPLFLWRPKPRSSLRVLNPPTPHPCPQRGRWQYIIKAIRFKGHRQASNPTQGSNSNLSVPCTVPGLL
jgi:hypothetical protein